MTKITIQLIESDYQRLEERAKRAGPYLSDGGV